jgi:glucose/arabinose dehydrogenase
MALTGPGAAATAALLLCALAGCAGDGPVPAAAPSSGPAATSSAAPPSRAPEVLFTGLQVPWGMAFLPNGDALVSERETARVLRLPAGGGAPVEVTTLAEVEPAGEGGLLGLAVAPTFDQDGLVYAYLTAADDNRIVRFPLDRPTEVDPVLTGIPKGGTHNGGRIAFAPDGTLYAGTGDAGEPSRAQDDDSLGGKVLRMTPEGDPVGSGTLVFSKGHRNVQGLAFDGQGRVFAVEFGQNRFDEVNLLREGGNAGWPEVEGAGDGGGRFLAPLVTWETSEASPSGAALLGDSLYVAALRGQRLWRVPLDGSGGAGEPEALLQGEYGRLRTATRAPDGSLWVLTSNRDGRGEPVETDDRVVRVPV